jgi:acyl carrier protein
MRWLSKAAIFHLHVWEIFTVLDRSNSSPVDRVAALVCGLLAKRSVNRPVGTDEDLSEAGLTSLDMVNLMLAVEAEFDLKIPDRDMTPANFRSIARIEALVGALLQNA